MNNDNRHSSADWYAPLTPAQTRPAEQAAPKKKKRRGLPTGWRLFLGTLILVGLITGSSLYFSDGEEQPLQNSGFQIVLPGPDDNTGEEMPEDWQSYFDSYYTVEDSDKPETGVARVEERPDWELKLEMERDYEQGLQDIYRTCEPSIVGVETGVSGRRGGYWGSGIILSEDGLILTNAHLVEGCDTVSVSLSDGRSFPALLVGVDWTTDLAVLKIEARGLKPAVFGDSDALAVGEHVAAIGNPIGENYRATMTDGIVSGINRDVEDDDSNTKLIQTNTPINEGSSGGALLNMYGQVVGVTHMKLVSFYSSIEGFCFAIPSATVHTVVNALIRDGEVRGRTAIGITVGAVTQAAAEYYELPTGLYVFAVSEGSDAWKKGMQEGDIITAVNGLPTATNDDILNAKEGLQVGDLLHFTVWRDGKSIELDVALVEYNDVYS